MARRIASVADLNALKEEARADVDLRGGAKEIEATVHMGTCGISAGARDVVAEFLASPDLAGRVTLRQAGCQGLCEQEPMMTLLDKSGKKFVYVKLDKHKTREIIREHILGGKPLARYLIQS
jgi:NADP-reducing hydrogenase subunit HndB